VIRNVTQIAAITDVCSFKVAIFIFYESAAGEKGLEKNDGDRSCS